MDVSKAIRSQASLLNKDTKLDHLISKVFGFSKKQRIFKSARNENLNINDQITNNDNIGQVSLRTFINEFGLLHEISQKQIEKLNQSNSQNTINNKIIQKSPFKIENMGFTRVHLESDDLYANEKLDYNPFQSLITPKKSEITSSINYQQGHSKSQFHPLSQLLNNIQFKKTEVKSPLPQEQQKFTFADKIKNVISQNKQDASPQPDIFKKVELFNNKAETTPFSLYKSYGETLLSAQNTPMKPFKQENSPYPYFSEQKQFKVQKNLFQKTQNMINSPVIPIKNIQPRDLFNNTGKQMQNTQNNLLNKSKSYQESGTPIGTKRKNEVFLQELQEQVQNSNNIFATPLQSSKRQKLDPYFTGTSKKETNNEESLDSDQSGDEKLDNNDDVNGNSSASRKKRGLKILSVKVQELVYKKQSTTYKDVANELIKQLRENKKGGNDFDGIDDSMDEGEDEEMSEESPTKRSTKDGECSSSQQKWEKNVRRRVYDALNVLYAAGVLKKEGKHVSCDNKVLQMTNKLREQQSATKSYQSSVQKQYTSVQDQKLLQEIELLKAKLNSQQQRNNDKRDVLFDQFKYFVSYKHLLERNKYSCQRGLHFDEKLIYLPFILVSTKDNPDNEVEISYGDNHKSLNISMKHPLMCDGDADTLIKLGLYKIDQDWMSKFIPNSNFIMNHFTERQNQEILN